MSEPGDYIPEDALSPRGMIDLKVMIVERDGGAREVVLRATEADGTLHFFPLDASSARWLAGKLVESADSLDSEA